VITRARPSVLPVAGAFWLRSLNEVTRVRGALLPTTIAPLIFLLGMSGQFGRLTGLHGFPTDSYLSWIVPLSCLQGAGFAGAAAGANLARDIEQGWFDRLLASPAPRPTLLAGMVFSAAIRALVPAVILLGVALAIGAHWPGLLGLLLAFVAVMGMGVAAACWGTALALRFRSQSAAPLMQAGMFILVLMSTAYAPLELLQGWLHTVASINPATQVLEMARQGFIGDVSWGNTWPGLLALVGLIAVLATFALRGMARMAD
jgi:ABC-2 type transport system permease protein